jgi:hypothetical protein
MMAAPVIPPKEPALDGEPAITRTVLAGIVGAFALLVIARINRSADFLDGSELDQAKALITLVAPVAAGWLIRAKVTPTTRAVADKEHAAKFFMAAGYAQALEDNPPPPAPPPAPPPVPVEIQESPPPERRPRPLKPRR